MRRDWERYHSTLFASAVLKSRVQGTVNANDLKESDTCYIAHPYGMSLLIGHTELNEFNSISKEYLLDCGSLRNRKEWLQVYPASWNDKISELVDSRVMQMQLPVIWQRVLILKDVLPFPATN